MQIAGDRVLPADGEGLDVLLLPRRQLVERDLQAVLYNQEDSSAPSTLEAAAAQAEELGTDYEEEKAKQRTVSIPSPVERLFAVPIAT